LTRSPDSAARSIYNFSKLNEKLVSGIFCSSKRAPLGLINFSFYVKHVLAITVTNSNKLSTQDFLESYPHETFGKSISTYELFFAGRSLYLSHRE